MRKIVGIVILSFFVLLGNLVIAQTQDPTVMEIDGNPVSRSEFLQIYLKNNPDPKFDKASLDEYMLMFKRFKLKVAEAEALGYDTIPKLKKELEGYRKQLANPYLIDSAANILLVQEAYNRMKTEIRASHILIKCDLNASPKDTLNAWNKVMACKARIEKGEDFASVAKSKTGSEDPSVVNNGGDLGYFTAFQMVYPFEDKAYNTPDGKISDPVRTRFGYHIIKVTDKRPARGTIKVAHLMIQASKNETEENVLNAEKRINELYEKLVSGESWDALVQAFTEDAATQKKNGELPMFGSGTTQRMVSVFEDAAFALKKDGDFSKPIKTDYGFHIIKRLELKDIAAFETMKKEIQSKVNKDDRAKKTQASFVEKLKKQYGYKSMGTAPLVWFDKNLDTTYYNGKWSADKLNTDLTIFELGLVNKKFTQKDFANYLVKNYRGVKKEDIKSVVFKQEQNWEKLAILEYEESVLEAKYPDYKALLKEYHDGIILYEVMSDQVWNKAIKDTAGLRSYFEQNRDNYMWPRRYDAVVYECSSLKYASAAYKMLKKKKNTSKNILDKLNATSELNVKVKMNKLDPEQYKPLKDREFLRGRNKPFEFEGKFYVVELKAELPIMRKELTETKGPVTSDYQNFLEKKWMEEITKNHVIKVYDDILYNLNK